MSVPENPAAGVYVNAPLGVMDTVPWAGCVAAAVRVAPGYGVLPYTRTLSIAHQKSLLPLYRNRNTADVAPAGLLALMTGCSFTRVMELLSPLFSRFSTVSVVQVVPPS